MSMPLLTIAIVIAIAVLIQSTAADSSYNATETVFVDGREYVLPNDGQPSLFHYIDIPDTNTFSWNADYNPYYTNSTTGLSYYKMNVTSLKWLDESEVDFPIWKHENVIIKPDTLHHHDTSTAILHISRCLTRGDNSSCYLAELGFLSDLVQRTNVIGVLVYGIPNQKLKFSRDPKGVNRQEDYLLSFSWEIFMKDFQNNRNRPDWIGLFPMVKASFRCLEATFEWSKKMYSMGKLTAPLTKWYPFGLSKRGATTWLLSAYLGARYPHRIIGSSPVIYDLLAFEDIILDSIPSKLQGFPQAFEPYVDAIPMFLKPEYRNPLAKHIDPSTKWYRDGLSVVPKFIISAALDEFFLLGNDRYWFDLVENKHRLIIPTANHGFQQGLDWLLAALAGHIRTVVYKGEIPEITGKIDFSIGKIEMCSTVRPTQSTLYRAAPNPNSPQRLDYRLVKKNIEGECLEPAYKSGDNCINFTEFKETKLEAFATGSLWCSWYQDTDGLESSDKWYTSFIVMKFGQPGKEYAIYSSPPITVPDTAPFQSCRDTPNKCPITFV